MKRFLAPFIAILIIAGGVGAYALQDNAAQQPSATKPVPTVTPVTASTVSYRGVEGKTAMEILESTHQVTKKEYSFGALVTGIDGTDTTSDKAWMFYVNGTQPAEGAGTYKTASSDTIEWRYEEIKQ